jgi:hypothetical protein
MSYSHYHDDHYHPGRIPDGVTHFIDLIDSLNIADLFVRPVLTCESTPCVDTNTSFIFEYKGFRIIHLGDAQADIANISDPAHQALLLEKFQGRIDVLLMTVQGIQSLIPEAEMFIDLLQPGIVIPMHYWTPQYKEDFMAYLELQNDTAGKSYEVIRRPTADLSFDINDTIHDHVKVIGLTAYPYGSIDSPTRNKALNCPVSASSELDSNHIANRLVDGYYETAWRNQAGNDQRIVIDMKYNYLLDTICINALVEAVDYEIAISIDSLNWTSVYTYPATELSVDSIFLDGVKARFVSIQLNQSQASNQKYWIREIEVFARLVTRLPEIPFSDRPVLYPNPACEEVHIHSVPVGNAWIEIYDAGGSCRLKERLALNLSGKDQATVNISGLATGLYIVTIRTENRSESQKLIIQH